jgi:subtilase family serine protease
VTPQFTNPEGMTNVYALAPEDFATQYDLGPLYKTGTNGAGQTIGIINESNIDLTLANAYRELFNLSNNPPQLVIDGADPGQLGGVDVEAYLDVEVSGAVAPGATLNLYIANGSDVQVPLALAALRAIEDNQAAVLSVSFGECEKNLGEAGKQLWSGLWEQAAAQGQTVFVSSGDSGSAGCDPAGTLEATGGLAVNGLASSGWNVAVGGTDFYYSDYLSGAPSAATLWNQTNDSSDGSLIAPLPEQPWNEALS